VAAQLVASRAVLSSTELVSYVYCTNCIQLVFLRSVLRLLVTANVDPSSLILSDLMMEATCSSETSVLTRAIWGHISEEGILHSYSRENHKSYVALAG
jgi:hypothetical protein